MKRLVALLLVLAMVLTFAACGVAPADAEKGKAAGEGKTTEVTAATDPESLDRADKEQIVDLLGDGSLSADQVADMSDEELDKLVQNLVSDLDQEEVVNLGNENPMPDVEIKEEYYDEEGGMTIPFDEAYPELVESGNVPFSNESLLIKLESGKLTNGLKAAGVVALEETVPLKGCAWYTAKLLEGTDAYKALSKVRQLDEVLLAELNYVVTTALVDGNGIPTVLATETDSSETDGNGNNGNGNGNNKPKEQWHLQHCGIPNGYGQMKNSGGDSSVIVAVIDTGVDYDHEDLAQNIWKNTAEIPDNGIDDDKNGYVDDYYGVDIVSGRGNGDDTNGHGTHVAGIIAAQNNKMGVVGIAFNVQIMPVKAAAHSGYFLQGDIAKAVQYAWENGAEVINMSFGGTACSIAVQDALANAYTQCVLVASAGNSGYPNQQTDYFPVPMPNYPGALTYVLGVMSVNQSGVESGFTNWDAVAFNDVEYELYAPGEAIVSTLPNNTYGALSGTSMAAPMVSACAAILRGEFTDRDKYPTKFIYGQLASTSGDTAICCDPELHAVNRGPHNMPQIVNLYDALTKLPKPEVGMQEYHLFDLPKYSSKNNGDGVIDAGETIALGLVLRNRWGMSENTVVTIDTLSQAGIADPYITIQNPSVNYGSVGTYSTQDCGKIFTDELFTDWEEPFLITISEDCPNDYIFTINVTVTCENALDEADTTVYSSRGKVMEYVRSGYILPSIIDEDMVLTKDNLYIIPSSTIIEEGVTVKVMPGTHIQFWSDDADDPYADSYIAYLLVNGTFLVEGTKEDPVYIYPSQLMDRYGVEIGSSAKGYVSLKYADITNFAHPWESAGDHTGTGNRIDLADHCTFRNNYSGYIYWRSLNGGVVGDYFTEICDIGHINAKDSVFYKLAFRGSTNLYGTFDRCIFAQCGIDYDRMTQLRDCVFLGNSLVDQTNPDTYYNSSLDYDSYYNTPKWGSRAYRVAYRAETGTTYLTYYSGSSSVDATQRDIMEANVLAERLGGHLFVPDSLEEYQWLKARDGFENLHAWAYRSAEGGFVWSDGTPVQACFLSDDPYITTSQEPYGCLWQLGSNGKLYFDLTYGYTIEIPGQVLVEEITFGNYSVLLDLESTYQLAPKSQPVQYGAEDFLYESTDETVLTVSESGIVTPVGKGTADVWVYSLDKAVKNRVSFTVKDYVALESLALPMETMELAVGESYFLNPVLTPADTTRNMVTYTSSDEGVVKADRGVLTAVSEGTATITAACEGFTAEMTVTVYTKATSLDLNSIVLSAALSDGTMELPQVVTNDGADTILSWRSTDEAVAAIESGKLHLKKAGTTSLIVVDSRSGLSAACLVIVGESGSSPVKDMHLGTYNSAHFVLLENGDLYVWDSNHHSSPLCFASDVKAFDADADRCATLFEDGTIKQWIIDRAIPHVQETHAAAAGWKITELAYAYENGDGNYYVVTEDGNVYAWGNYNTYGQLGIGSTQTTDTPALINLDDVVDVKVDNKTSWFLTEQGDLYAAGDLSYTNASAPVLIDTGVAKIGGLVNGGYWCNYLTTDGKWKRFDGSNPESSRYGSYSVDLFGLDHAAIDSSNYEGIGIRDGEVYTFRYDSASLTKVHGITDAVQVYTNEGTHYIVTESGLLLGFGKNGSTNNHMAGMTVENPVTVPVVIPLVPLAEESAAVVGTNLETGVLTSGTLVLTFNKRLTAAAPKLYADGVQVTMQSTISDYNHLIVSRTAGLSEGVNYELVLDAGIIYADGGITNDQEIRIAFTYAPAEQEAPDAGEEGTETTQPETVIYESILDETVERVLTKEKAVELVEAYVAEGNYNYQFHGNAILNPISTDFEVSHWLRVQAPSVSAGTKLEMPLGGNWWGSVNERAIGLQMIDYTDFVTYGQFNYAPYLTSAPENTFPFVTSVTLLNKDGEAVTKVGNEKVTFRVTFNRDMDTSIPLIVRFGSAYPYGDYQIEGQYVDARTWEGVYTLNTLIENGNQYFSIQNGCSATEDLPLQWDLMRFSFEIDTTSAQALIMQGIAEDEGIQLTWTQDDFDTLMGYNVYRSTSEDGLYTRVNATTIPVDTKEFFDTNVEPGVVYYYNFTVVKTDLTESEPSGKIVIMSKDTMAPSIYHSGVAIATMGRNLVISATISDNLNVAYANVYYRTVGDTEWKTVRMNCLNSKYAAIIPAAAITQDGLEYYIEAFDGVSSTTKGSAESPYTVMVQESVESNDMGDVDGNGVINNRDALMLLQAIHDKYNMSAEEFARADLDASGNLEAWEALRILQYISGTVGSVDMRS